MSITNSELLEELLIECYNQNIIEDVRKEAVSIMDLDVRVSILEAYEMAFQKISKKN